MGICINDVMAVLGDGGADQSLVTQALIRWSSEPQGLRGPADVSAPRLTFTDVQRAFNTSFDTLAATEDASSIASADFSHRRCVQCWPHDHQPDQKDMGRVLVKQLHISDPPSQFAEIATGERNDSYSQL